MIDNENDFKYCYLPLKNVFDIIHSFDPNCMVSSIEKRININQRKDQPQLAHL